MIDITDQRFGLLTAVKPTERRYKREIFWKCVCDCGNESEVRGSALRGGAIRSCGCVRIEKFMENRFVGVGSDNPKWKGDDVGYVGLHGWLRRNYNKTGTCTNCEAGVGGEGSNGTQWANISGDYKRDINDYLELCPKCHAKFDSFPKVTPILDIF